MKYLILVLALGLAGCAGLEQRFETNATCVIGKQEARADSQWGLFGISTKLSNGGSICPAPVTK